MGGYQTGDATGEHEGLRFSTLSGPLQKPKRNWHVISVSAMQKNKRDMSTTFKFEFAAQ